MATPSYIHTFFFDTHVKIVVNNVTYTNVLDIHRQVYGNEFFLHKTFPIEANVIEIFKKDILSGKFINFVQFSSDGETEPDLFIQSLTNYIDSIKLKMNFMTAYPIVPKEVSVPVSIPPSEIEDFPRFIKSSRQTNTTVKREYEELFSVKSYITTLPNSRHVDISVLADDDNDINNNYMYIEKETMLQRVYYDNILSVSRIFDFDIPADLFPEFTFVQELNMIDINCKDFLTEKHLSNIFYEKVEDLQKIIDAFSLIYNFGTNKSKVENKKLTIEIIRKHVSNHFDFNIENEKLRSSDLIQMIFKQLEFRYSTEELKKLKNIIPAVMKEMKVEKRRLKDGNYYMGIRISELSK